jgi:hypothetical protein
VPVGSGNLKPEPTDMARLYFYFHLSEEQAEFTAETQRTQRGRRGSSFEKVSFEIPTLKFEPCIPLRFLRVLCASAVSTLNSTFK